MRSHSIRTRPRLSGLLHTGPPAGPRSTNFKGGPVAGDRLQSSVSVRVRWDICLELEPDFRVRLQRKGAAGPKGRSWL
jgi:hypothetical protein